MANVKLSQNYNVIGKWVKIRDRNAIKLADWNGIREIDIWFNSWFDSWFNSEFLK